MDKISDPQPWAQKKYWHSRPRILVVGSSHHGEEDERHGDALKNFTKDVMIQRVDGGHGYFYRMPEAVLGENLSQSVQTASEGAAREEFWAHTAFVNYVEEVLLKPGSGSWTQMTSSFTRMKAVLRELKPDLVLFFASLAFDNFETNLRISHSGRVTAGPPINGMKVILSNEEDSEAKIAFARLRHPRNPGVAHQVWRQRVEQLRAWWETQRVSK